MQKLAKFGRHYPVVIYLAAFRYHKGVVIRAKMRINDDCVVVLFLSR
jgi:hypothetical protein